MSTPTAEEKNTLGARAARGTLMSVGSQLATQVLRLGSNLILTRLLDPDAFGLIAVVLAITQGLQLISDVGIWAAIIRSERGDDPDFLNTAFTLQAVRGVGLFGIGLAATVPAALFYHRDEFHWLLPLCALQAVVQGFESTKLAVANRQMRIGIVVLVDLVAQTAALCVSIPLAFYLRSVMALVAASLVAVVVRTIASHAFVSGQPNRFRWERSALNEIFHFGKWIFVSTILYFVSQRWDVFALGRLEGMGLVGIYGLAQLIVGVPAQIGEKVMGFVYMPAIAQSFRASPEEFARSVRRARGILGPAAMILFLGASLTAPAFFRLFYRDVYADAGWMTQLLIVAAWAGFLQDASSRTLLAVGDSRALAVVNALRLVAVSLGTYVGFMAGGFIGFMVGTAVASLASVGVVLTVLSLRGLSVWRSDLASTCVLLLFLAVGAGVPHLVSARTGIHFAWLTLVSVVALLLPLAAVVVQRTRAALRERPDSEAQHG